MTEVFTQQCLQGDSRVGFRNSDAEPWQMYRTPIGGAVLNFIGERVGPKPEWTRELEADSPMTPSAALTLLRSPGFNIGCHHLPECARMKDRIAECDCGYFVRRENIRTLSEAIKSPAEPEYTDLDWIGPGNDKP